MSALNPFSKLPRNTRRLIAARAARSVGQGALVVDFSLYLHALHWSAAVIGAVLSGALLVGAVLTLVTGPLSDRIGRRAFLLAYEGSQLVAALLALLSSRPEVLVPAALLGGFGRGAGGGAGPFAPVEQAWLAAPLEDRDRGRVYSLNTAVGFFGMGMGALLAALPDMLTQGPPGPGAYRPLFGLVLLGALASILALRGAAESPSATPPSAAAQPDTRAENGRLLRLAAINALNGTGIGLVGPLMAYWFMLRFGKGAAAIAPVMAFAFVITALASLFGGWLSTRLGVVRTVVWMRMVGLGLLVLMPLAPTFAWAATFYVLRGAFNLGTAGARQALNMGLVHPNRRGLAASLSSVSIQVPRAIGPAVAGVLFQAGWLALPFLLAASFQGAYVFFYRRVFHRYDPAVQARVPLT
ncbi:MAG: MFS transporter [Chromatiales bacterium 21-64-14]|nr:MAG: MFS transporter [Chromatiales bacterium 21-64-14]HQU16248.1 MFS transporter [Gammaproteobacteria bacterium]